jgi:hypothetical protein
VVASVPAQQADALAVLVRRIIVIARSPAACITSSSVRLSLVNIESAKDSRLALKRK